MKVRFVIDRVVLEGLSLSRGEREMLEIELRDSLRLGLMARAVGAEGWADRMPKARAIAGQQAELSLHSDRATEGLGASLGSNLVDWTWATAATSNSSFRRR